MNPKVGVIGLGVVGNAIFETLKEKSVDVVGYDKFKNGGIGNIENCLSCDYLFLCLPTPYSPRLQDYDLEPLNNVISSLQMLSYNGLIIIKSTINPGTTDNFSKKFSNLNFVHNPEFLTARNAKKDFDNQIQIVLGKSNNCSEDKFNNLVIFYKNIWPESIVSVCNSGESEIMKLGCNTFYAVKIQYLTELYLLCKKEGLNFDKVKNMILINGGMGPNYTNVPGHDGSISYSGMCFPKDTNALCSFMKKNGMLCNVLDATIKERNLLRDDQQFNLEKE